MVCANLQAAAFSEQHFNANEQLSLHTTTGLPIRPG
jgi:hypothetical protein